MRTLKCACNAEPYLDMQTLDLCHRLCMDMFQVNLLRGSMRQCFNILINCIAPGLQNNILLENSLKCLFRYSICILGEKLTLYVCYMYFLCKFQGWEQLPRLSLIEGDDRCRPEGSWEIIKLGYFVHETVIVTDIFSTQEYKEFVLLISFSRMQCMGG